MVVLAAAVALVLALMELQLLLVEQVIHLQRHLHRVIMADLVHTSKLFQHLTAAVVVGRVGVIAKQALLKAALLEIPELLLIMVVVTLVHKGQLAL
jgi:hypothetical protein